MSEPPLPAEAELIILSASCQESGGRGLRVMANGHSVSVVRPQSGQKAGGGGEEDGELGVGRRKGNTVKRGGGTEGGGGGGGGGWEGEGGGGEGEGGGGGAGGDANDAEGVVKRGGGGEGGEGGWAEIAGSTSIEKCDEKRVGRKREEVCLDWFIYWRGVGIGFDSLLAVCLFIYAVIGLW